MNKFVMHLVRGIAGFGFLYLVLRFGPDLGWWALAPAAAALVCLRGCPMCWTLGLIETVLDRKSGAICADGSCALRGRAPRGRDDILGTHEDSDDDADHYVMKATTVGEYLRALGSRA